jgi:hypothetical protein
MSDVNWHLKKAKEHAKRGIEAAKRAKKGIQKDGTKITVDKQSICFHCNRPLVDNGADDPNVDRLKLTMSIQKWSIDLSAITYLCACGANTTRLGTVTAAYHDTWDREFGD